jgi:hypothetical protein
MSPTCRAFFVPPSATTAQFSNSNGGYFRSCLAPEDLVVPVRVERRIDIDQIDAAVWQLAELIEIIATVNDARIHERGRFPGGGGHRGTVRDVSTLLKMTTGNK